MVNINSKVATGSMDFGMNNVGSKVSLDSVGKTTTNFGTPKTAFWLQTEWVMNIDGNEVRIKLGGKGVPLGNYKEPVQLKKNEWVDDMVFGLEQKWINKKVAEISEGLENGTIKQRSEIVLFEGAKGDGKIRVVIKIGTVDGLKKKVNANKDIDFGI